MMMICTVFGCGWTFTGSDPDLLRVEERRHWDEYHSPEQEED